MLATTTHRSFPKGFGHLLQWLGRLFAPRPGHPSHDIGDFPSGLAWPPTERAVRLVRSARVTRW